MNYLMLHEDLFPVEADEDYDNKDLEDLDEREMIPGLNELPAYCFSPRDPETDLHPKKVTLKSHCLLTG